MTEILPGIQLGIDQVMGFLIKAVMVFVAFISLVMVRQAGLMDKVVNVSVGGNIKLFVRVFSLVSLVLTGIVILVS